MRRKKTIGELPEGWYETIVSLGSQGKTQLSIHKALGISQSLFERFREEEPEFKQAVKEFRMESSLFWTDLARAYALGDPDVIKCCIVIWVMALFPYRNNTTQQIRRNT